MIARLVGDVVEKKEAKDFLVALVDVHGVGYEVLLPKTSHARLAVGEKTIFYVSESVTAFDGATTLYGFLSAEEKEFFMQLRENVEGMGPKKALECMDKVSKSLPDFKRAVAESDSRLLVSVFGFTKKTADKLIFSLKDKVNHIPAAGSPKWPSMAEEPTSFEALSGLVNLGFREEEAREMLGKAKRKLGDSATTENLLNEVLKQRGVVIS